MVLEASKRFIAYVDGRAQMIQVNDRHFIGESANCRPICCIQRVPFGSIFAWYRPAGRPSDRVHERDSSQIQ